MGDLSQHFSSREFACRHCGQLPRGGISPVLLAALEKLRAAGYARRANGLAVVSGYRCAARQLELQREQPDRAATYSQHTVGTACDVEPVLSLARVKALQLFSGIGWQYLGLYPLRKPYVVHVDVRHAGHLNPGAGTPLRPATWQYR